MIGFSALSNNGVGAEIVIRFARARRGAVSVLFAAGAIPMIGLVGLAIDYGVWNQTNATLSVAANVAALTAAKIAANEQVASVSDAQVIADGTAAGQEWFKSEVGGVTGKVGTEGVSSSTVNATVKVTTGTTVTANVAFAGYVPSVFGAIFGIGNYQIDGSATASVGFAPFLNVDILLDNSGSMEIGALDSDIQHLQAITPCYPALAVNQYPNAMPPDTYQAPGAFYNGNNAAGQSYAEYNYDGFDSDGVLTAPATTIQPPQLYATFIENQQPACKNVLRAIPNSSPASYPPAGPPCAFACHFDTSKPAGTGNDFYALARSTIGSAKPITLRFDLVKAATSQVVNAMQTDNIPGIDNLRVGIFTFADVLARVYPDATCGSGIACEASNNWTSAVSDIGSPPTFANGPDTGIQPYSGGNEGNSDFHDTMTQLSTAYLSKSGDGTSATTPRKVLFLITDGLVDYSPGGNRTYGGVNSADCTLFKNLGYTVYVVFTPYYPVMNGFYIGNIKQYAEPTATSTIAQAMQACSSDPTADYVSASDGPGLNNALQKFLRAALRSPVKFTN
jgi:Flp pilus assembly protein TadG